jgi:hypothetical protein
VSLFDIDVGVAQDFTYQLVYPESSSQDPRVLAFRMDAERDGAAGPADDADIEEKGFLIPAPSGLHVAGICAYHSRALAVLRQVCFVVE